MRGRGGCGWGDARHLLRRSFIRVLTTAAAGCLCERVWSAGKGVHLTTLKQDCLFITAGFRNVCQD